MRELRTALKALLHELAAPADGAAEGCDGTRPLRVTIKAQKIEGTVQRRFKIDYQAWARCAFCGPDNCWASKR